MNLSSNEQVYVKASAVTFKNEAELITSPRMSMPLSPPFTFGDAKVDEIKH